MRAGYFVALCGQCACMLDSVWRYVTTMEQHGFPFWVGVPNFVWNATDLRLFYEDIVVDESAGFVAAFNQSKQFVFRRFVLSG